MDLINKPDDYYNRVRRYSTGVILSIVYGRRGPQWKGAVSDIYEVMDPWSESEPIPSVGLCILLTMILVVETGATYVGVIALINLQIPFVQASGRHLSVDQVAT